MGRGVPKVVSTSPKEVIQAEARRLGFDVCRITTAAPPVSGPRLLEALAQGRLGEMQWLARNAEKRVDLDRVLSGVRSVVILAVNYGDRRDALGSPGPAATVIPGACPAEGVIARYARYDDYHDLLGGALIELTAVVNALGVGTRSLWYVDTGPVLERDLAQRAGVGFVGKHTNLISRQMGNWFFLAEILTTLELEPDLAEPNRCGSCTRCLTACPTGALPAPFTLDSRRCISYLTIELKGSIPLELRPLIGNRIYGCDDCLAVCPWNRFAREASLLGAHRREDLEQPVLRDLLRLDDAEFKRRFAGTPILRTRRRGLLRNVCVALGNVGGVEALPDLEGAAADSEPLIVEHAVWAIGRILERQRR